MMKKYKTEQESFWSGDFGDGYNKRNRGQQFTANQTFFFSKILSRTDSVKSVMEFGANIGENLKAIKNLLPDVKLSAVEINKDAVKELRGWKEGKVKIYDESILDFKVDSKRDFVFTKGVLIHINPNELVNIYRLMYETSGRYICIAEYYSPKPETMLYRGEKDRLFKRDFCGEIMQKYPDLKLVDYGFGYHGDPNFPQDDVTWFLLEK